MTFVLLQEAISAGMFHLVGRADVPKRARRFPLLRAAGPQKAGTGQPSAWWLWDGKKETKIQTVYEGFLTKNPSAAPPATAGPQVGGSPK